MLFNSHYNSLIHSFIQHIFFEVCEVLGTILSVVNTTVKRIGGGDFPGGAVVKNPPANAGDTGLSPGPGRSHMLRRN